MGCAVGLTRGLADVLCVGWNVDRKVGRSADVGAGRRVGGRVGLFLGVELGADEDNAASSFAPRVYDFVVYEAASCPIVDSVECSFSLSGMLLG